MKNTYGEKDGASHQESPCGIAKTPKDVCQPTQETQDCNDSTHFVPLKNPANRRLGLPVGIRWTWHCSVHFACHP